MAAVFTTQSSPPKCATVNFVASPRLSDLLRSVRMCATCSFCESEAASIAADSAPAAS